MIYDEPLFLPAGDSALVVELGDAIDPQLNHRVHNLCAAIHAAAQSGELRGVFDFLPTYRSALVYYDPMLLTAGELRAKLRRLLSDQAGDAAAGARVVHVPTLYGGDMGPDIGFVAQHAGVSEDEVVAIHSGVDYLVYMMGFSPGFAYLGGLDERLATPRLTSPRTVIPAGAVSIAESQTGVYPVASPGGWQLIGRTPLRLFDPKRNPPVLLNAGDFVRFTPLGSQAEYDAILQRVESDDYTISEGMANG